MEEFKREMKTLTVRLKEAENRAEQAEKSVKRLQKEVDRLEGASYPLIPYSPLDDLVLVRFIGFRFVMRSWSFVDTCSLCRSSFVSPPSLYKYVVVGVPVLSKSMYINNNTQLARLIVIYCTYYVYVERKFL